MSIVALADGTKSSVTSAILHDVAAKNNIKISSKADEEAYLLLLQSADATVASVNELPDYIDPRLKPVPVIGGSRKYWKAEKNSLNAWSHRTVLNAETPISSLLKNKSVAAKDNMSVAGLPFTCGTFPQLASSDGNYPIPAIDAIIVQRVIQAGATIIGTSTCENYSLTPMSYTSINGPVSNPWLFGHSAGGSTSGGSCLLALSLAREAGVPGLADAGDSIDLALGGDQGGSIRLPASYCGIYGLKPTHGLVPYTGIASLHPLYDHCGPMARSLQDIATMLTVLAGYDGLDPRMTPESPLPEFVPKYHEQLQSFTTSSPPSSLGKSLRVGIISESLTMDGVSPSIASMITSAAETHFTRAGATVSHVSLPLHALGPAIWTAATRIALAELALKSRAPDLLSHPLPHYSPRWPPDQEFYELLTAANPAVIHVLFSQTLLADKYSSAVQAKAHRHVLQLRAAYDAALQDFDVLITPTAPDVAPPHPPLSPTSTVMQKVLVSVGATGNTCPFNVTGHPGLSVPCGWGAAKEKDGVSTKGWLPVGMQIIGRRWDEIGVLKAAAVFEAGGGGLGKWPGAV